MEAQKEKWLGDPVLHGEYQPQGHPGRSYQFWNNGDFISVDHPSCLEMRKFGHGYYELKGKVLKLVFLPEDGLEIPDGLESEKPHEEVYQLSLKGNKSYEISCFRIKIKEKLQAKLIWKRLPGTWEYRERALRESPDADQE